jgi:hypothetical protein
MLEVEREEVSGGAPNFRSRAAASLLERPESGVAVAVATHLLNMVAAGWG